MSSPTQTRRSRPRLLGDVADSFWTADEVLIGVLVFFIVLGAVDPLDSLPITTVLLVLIGLWTAHVVSLRRR